ncbi:MAG: nucleotidyltransferase domain-containing protein [Candidatus Korobacteraceae bacterium]
MDREQVIRVLREHEQELKNAGIVRLSLFGSVARGESGHDVDLLADFEPSRRLSLLDMAGLEVRLSDLLGSPVDLAPAKMLKEAVAERADQEAVLVF